MSNLSDVINTQNKLQENISKRFDDLQTQITNAGCSKDTVAKIGKELRNFREIIYGILSLLRQQIRKCAKQVDDIDTRSRRKALIITGLPEQDKEDCFQLVHLKVCNKKLGINNISQSTIKACHRLGTAKKQQQQSILVRFSSVDIKMAVWSAKSRLKGSSVSLKEFLTRTRQAIFAKSRLHFGMHSVRTQSGVIFIKTPCGGRHKVTTEEELNPLIAKYSRPPGKSPGKNSGSRS